MWWWVKHGAWSVIINRQHSQIHHNKNVHNEDVPEDEMRSFDLDFFYAISSDHLHTMNYLLCSIQIQFEIYFSLSLSLSLIDMINLTHTFKKSKQAIKCITHKQNYHRPGCLFKNSKDKKILEFLCWIWYPIYVENDWEMNKTQSARRVWEECGVECSSVSMSFSHLTTMNSSVSDLQSD